MKKNLVFGFVLAICLIMVANVQAQQIKNNPGNLTERDIQNIQNSAKGLREVFGINEPRPANPTTPDNTKNSANKDSEVTMAKVADKAVDLVNSMVVSAAATLQKVAPDVWRIMIKQQYAKALGDLIMPLGLFITALAVNLLYCRKIRDGYSCCEVCGNFRGLSKEEKQKQAQVISEHYDKHIGDAISGYGVPIVLFVVSIIWSLYNLSDSIKFLINPEFYAIRDMLMMILNKGQTM